MGKGMGGGRDGKREGCWAEGRGAIRGWILTGHPHWSACGPLAGCWGERLWGPAWPLGTAGCKAWVRAYLHLICIQVCQSAGDYSSTHHLSLTVLGKGSCFLT